MSGFVDSGGAARVSKVLAKALLREGRSASLRCRVVFAYVYDERGQLLEHKNEVVQALEVMAATGSQSGFKF